VLLSELCALKHPFGDASSQAALVMKIMRASPPALPSHYSPQLARLLVCCMQRQPLSRPSALQFLSLSTVQQQAARLDLLPYFPPAALRAGAITIEARLPFVASPVSVTEARFTPADAQVSLTEARHPCAAAPVSVPESRHASAADPVSVIEARHPCAAAAVSGPDCKTARQPTTEASAPKPTQGPTVRPVPADESNTDEGQQLRCGGAQGASHGRRQGERHQRQAASSSDDSSARPAVKGGSAPWELKPVCAERQRRATQSTKTWKGAGCSTDSVLSVVADDDIISADELGASASTPPRPAHIANAQSAAWVSGGSSTDGAAREVGTGRMDVGSGKKVEVGSGGRLEVDGGRQEASTGRQAGVAFRDVDACGARPQDESSHARRRGKSHPRIWQQAFQSACSPASQADALPASTPAEISFDERGTQPAALSPREREKSGLWAKRRGAAAAPSVSGKLQVPSLSNNGWEQVSSPIDRFVRQHCPESVTGPGGSHSPRDGLVIPTTRPETSPLLKLVLQNFPKSGVGAEGRWGDTGAGRTRRGSPRGQFPLQFDQRGGRPFEC
jgi:hypothetical protein